MNVQLDPTSVAPIYVQIGEQIRRQVAAGDLRPGDRLPPVRDLAERLGVNVNTVARAYAELAHDGVVLPRRGGGTVISAGAGERLRAERAARLVDLAEGAFVRALALGYTADEVEGAVALQAARWRARPAAALPVLTQRPAGTLAFVGSHDLSLEALIRRLARDRPPIRVEARYAGSLEGLVALVRGEAEIAACHLLDEESGEYNAPFVRRLLPGQPMLLVTLARRRQGLLVAGGNPRGIERLADLTRPDVVLANRPRGSGTRVLLDFLLRRAGIDPAAVAGYVQEYPTHLAVAAAVAQRAADAGLGIEAAAAAYGLGFVPLAEEPYELVIPAAAGRRPDVQALLAAIRSAGFRRLIGAMAGYDVSTTGEERIVG
ncbi:MAG: GntR family transcriptional regulator [Chloroflexi bacterium]|nr:GntR family transcriptional regulator [Chloroflexota bacterium]